MRVCHAIILVVLSDSNPILYEKPAPASNGAPTPGCDDNRIDNSAGSKCNLNAMPAEEKECTLQYLGCKKCTDECKGLPEASCATDAPNQDNGFCEGANTRQFEVGRVSELRLFEDNNVPSQFRYGTNVVWNLNAEPETAWEDTCTDSRQEVVDRESSVQTVKATQLVLLINNILCVLILSCCFPYMEVKRGYHKMSKEDMKELEISDPSVKTFNTRKFRLKWLSNIVKVSFLLMCTFTALAVKDFYVNQSQVGCSDLLSDNTFYGLGKILTKLSGVGNGLAAAGDACKVAGDAVGSYLGVL